MSASTWPPPKKSAAKIVRGKKSWLVRTAGRSGTHHASDERFALVLYSASIGTLPSPFKKESK